MGSEYFTGLFSKKGWRAIFLTNGQVYFGKTTRTTDREMALEVVYYLRQGEKPDENEKIEQVGLIKLGGELHKPKDKMNIALSQILFWEELQEDGDIVKKIKEHIAENGSIYPCVVQNRTYEVRVQKK